MGHARRPLRTTNVGGTNVAPTNVGPTNVGSSDASFIRALFQCHYHPSLNKLHCQVQASCHNERTLAVVFTQAQCGLEPGFLTMFLR